MSTDSEQLTGHSSTLVASVLWDDRVAELELPTPLTLGHLIDCCLLLWGSSLRGSWLQVDGMVYHHPQCWNEGAAKPSGMNSGTAS